jgi:uncharacterized protein (DUF3084 family)
MLLRLVTILISAALICISGCGKRGVESAPPPEGAASSEAGETVTPDTQAAADTGPTFEQIKQEGREAFAATAAYLVKQKEKGLAKLQEQMQSTEIDMQSLKDRANAAGEEAKARLSRIEEKWKAQLAAARAKLDEARTSATENWEKARQELDQSLAKLKQTYEEAAELVLEDSPTPAEK